MVILVKRKADGVDLAQLNLPVFCITHMKAMDPAQNLAMMLKHVNHGIQPLTCSRIFINGKECAGIQAEDVASDSTVLEVDV